MIFPYLQAGDRVAVIAPASRCTDVALSDLLDLLKSWALNPYVSEPIFGDDLLCANSDPVRFEHLKYALLNPEIRGVICARGGYGSMRLLPALRYIMPPAQQKFFLGMSDITALHLYLGQHWHWPTCHGGLNQDKFSLESIAATKALLFGELEQVVFVGTPMNEAAFQSVSLSSSIIGGNLSLVQTSIGTSWQMNARNKIIFLEEIGERGYQVDRMLEHLKQSGLLTGADAIIFGDFLEGAEPNGSSLIHSVLSRFAESLDIPVLSIEGVGHGPTNFPLPLGIRTSLRLGSACLVTCIL